MGLQEEARDVGLLIVKRADSTRSIINILGYPPEIAHIIQGIFGKNSFLIARWLKESNVRDNKYEESDSWLDRLGKSGSFMSNTGGSVLTALNGMRAATNIDTLKSFLEEHGYNPLSVRGEEDLSSWAEHFSEEIKKELSSEIMFYNTFGEDILSGKITNLAPYKKMNYIDAVRKYDQLQTFDKKKPLLTFDDGHRWIDVGKKSRLIKEHLNNCGSVGVMGMDEDRTMLGLFDSNDKAVTVVTWSPNEKRISGAEGLRYNGVSNEYHDYILAIIKHLGAWFDVDKSKSKPLALKYMLRNITENIDFIYEDTYSVIAEFKDHNGKNFYTDKYVVQDKIETDNVVKTLMSLTEEEQELIYMPKNKDFSYMINWTFTRAFKDYYKGVKPNQERMPLFIKEYE